MTHNDPQIAPFTRPAPAIRPEWIDFNGHLNMGYYLVLFDLAGDEAFATLGLGAAYAAQGTGTTYSGDARIAYLREVDRDTPLIATLQILDHSDKAIHMFQTLIHAAEGWLAATCETVSLHIDQSGPKVAAFPPDILKRVEDMAAAHAQLPRPDGTGRPIGIRRRAHLRSAAGEPAGGQPDR